MPIHCDDILVKFCGIFGINTMTVILGIYSDFWGMLRWAQEEVFVNFREDNVFHNIILKAELARAHKIPTKSSKFIPMWFQEAWYYKVDFQEWYVSLHANGNRLLSIFSFTSIFVVVIVTKLQGLTFHILIIAWYKVLLSYWFKSRTRCFNNDANQR